MYDAFYVYTKLTFTFIGLTQIITPPHFKVSQIRTDLEYLTNRIAAILKMMHKTQKSEQISWSH